MSKYSGSGCRIRGVSSRCLDRSLNPAAALGRLAGRHPKTTTPPENAPLSKAAFHPESSHGPTGRTQIPNPGARGDFTFLISHGRPYLIVP
jgi:hypothetical protein